MAKKKVSAKQKKARERFSKASKKCGKKKGNFQACMKKELKC